MLGLDSSDRFYVLPGKINCIHLIDKIFINYNEVYWKCRYQQWGMMNPIQDMYYRTPAGSKILHISIKMNVLSEIVARKLYPFFPA